MMAAPWPWWLAALVLAAVSLLHLTMVGKLMGGSGAWISLVNLREELRAAKEEEGLADAAALQAAMLEATLAQFGPDMLPPPQALPNAQVGDTAEAPPAESPPTTALRSPWTAHLVFVVALMLGGTVASLLRNGKLTLHLTLGDTFERMYGTGPGGVALLLVGGLLVGFGVRMAGGCTVGHGLNGCSRFQKGSLVSIMVFFAVGVAVAMGLSRLTGVR